MTATLALRPARRRRRTVTWDARSLAPRPLSRHRTLRALRAPWPLPLGAGPRLFVLGAGVLATAFLLALLYLWFATSIATGGYDLHALEARRDELRSENQLLQLRLQRLEAPSRIEAAAQQLGLQKATHILYLTAGPTLTLR